MDIDFSSLNNRNRISLNSTSSSNKVDAKPKSEATDSMQKSLDFTRFKENLNELMQMPEVRTEVVKVGRELADDDTFPGDEALEKIAWALLSPEDSLSDADNL